MPRTIITPPHGQGTVPDVPNFSWADYGMRPGMPRIIDLFTSRGLPASTSFNAGVIDAYPEAAEAMLKAGWLGIHRPRPAPVRPSRTRTAMQKRR